MEFSEDMVAHMRRVQTAQRELRELGVVWQMIESSAAISCPEEAESILPTLMQTRARFDDLQHRLIEQMAGENSAALGDQLVAKAQCTIDILVRNLFERTADVGFLATDDVVRSFCAAEPAERNAQRPAMVQRLHEYQAKYSVYDDVVLLDPAGEVLARLDTRQPLARSSDPLVAEALAAGSYVEHFRCSDLSASAQPALLYAHRIASAEGRALGVLVLRFRFTDEMDHVFAGMADPGEDIALVLVGEDNRAIASNDPSHVPLGARMRPVAAGQVGLTTFSGREYLAVSCHSPGYQGYPGPRGWRAVAMVSLLTAFRQRDGQNTSGDADVPLDNAALRAISANADEINRDLRRVVWNGQLMASVQHGASRRLKAVLNQVNEAGRRTRERVEASIRDLHRTSLARARHQVANLAQLAASIMDRNLYERANDCRWWALSPALQRLLAEPASEDRSLGLNTLLDHINSLYTVYSRLVVFDVQGRICGASNLGDGSLLLGQQVPQDWRDKVLTQRDSQQYDVSAFEPTGLHAHGDTYVYLAAVRRSQGQRDHLGGIAIVFHSAREFGGMVADILGERSGVAAFVEEGGRVLASTDAALASGLNQAFSGEAALVEFDGVHYACARVRARGYREFKTSDGYDNRVHALVALRLGLAERRQTAFNELVLSSPQPVRRESALEVAVFQVGAMRCALPASALVEAVMPSGMVKVPGTLGSTVGLLEVGGPQQARLVPVVCARIQFGVSYPARLTDGVVLVLRVGSRGNPNGVDQRALVGLRVDDVLSVQEVDRSVLHDAPGGFGQFAPWLGGVLNFQATGGGVRSQALVQMLEVDRMGLHELAMSVLPPGQPLPTPLAALAEEVQAPA